MTGLARDPSFLPLTMSASIEGARTATTEGARVAAQLVQRRTAEANAAAGECWAVLLAGCDSPGRKLLPYRLRSLAEATSIYTGSSWWFGDGSRHRYRVARAQARIEDAVDERDGADFAEAFMGYDQAVATAVALVRGRTGSPAR